MTIKKKKFESQRNTPDMQVDIQKKSLFNIYKPKLKSNNLTIKIFHDRNAL